MEMQMVWSHYKLDSLAVVNCQWNNGGVCVGSRHGARIYLSRGVSG